jgi:hypothetical protein
LLSFLPLYLIKNFSIRPELGGLGFWEAGSTAYTCIIIVVNCKVLTLLSRWNWVYVLVVLVSLGAWYAVAFITAAYGFLDYEFYQTFNVLTANGTYWLIVWLLCYMIFMKDLLIWGWQRNFAFGSHHIIEEMELLDRLGMTEGDNKYEPVSELDRADAQRRMSFGVAPGKTHSNQSIDIHSSAPADSARDVVIPQQQGRAAGAPGAAGGGYDVEKGTRAVYPDKPPGRNVSSRDTNNSINSSSGDINTGGMPSPVINVMFRKGVGRG